MILGCFGVHRMLYQFPTPQYYVDFLYLALVLTALPVAADRIADVAIPAESTLISP